MWVIHFGQLVREAPESPEVWAGLIVTHIFLVSIEGHIQKQKTKHKAYILVIAQTWCPALLYSSHFFPRWPFVVDYFPMYIPAGPCRDDPFGDQC